MSKDEVTPYSVYLNRRSFMKTSIFALSGMATYSVYRQFRSGVPTEIDSQNSIETPLKFLGTEKANSFSQITNYNNFYEFSTDKEAVANKSSHWDIKDWNLKIEGLVENPFSLSLKDIENIKSEERIYRFRCVEGWSMVVPWTGFQLLDLIEKAKPLSSAKYVAFESFFDESVMPSAKYAGIDFPYVEGLRLDEALHPLTFIATGIYDKKLPNQNGAPLRLVIPWKYGFKSLKSISKITFTDQEPPSTWNLANPSEYGFYSNVNPEVNHPRWSQAQERRLGESQVRPTLMMNGYEKEVASLYTGMDLRKNF